MNMNTLAIIPARGGSKRIIRKNVKDFCGKPIMYYSIQAAISSCLFSEVMVSTEDQEISGIAQKYGARVPFLRSQDNSSDFAGILDVIKEVLIMYKENRGVEFDLVCCILATAPLVSIKDISKARDLIINNDYDSTFPIVEFSYPIQRAFRTENDKVAMIWPENYNKRSQEFEKTYHDAGQFYWLRPERCIEKMQIFTDNSGFIELPPNRVQDIDTLADWEICEQKYKMIN